MLRFWAQDKEGNEIFSDQVEYGFNFTDAGGNEPAMVDAATGRGWVHVLEADKDNVESFRVEVPGNAGPITLKALMTYIHFVMPPPEAQNRMQQGLIDRVQRGTEEEKQKILNEEIPTRMASMNTLQSTYPPIRMAEASQTIEVP